MTRPLTVLVASDGSAAAQAAVSLAVHRRTTRGLNRLPLGSVADGLVSRSPVSVLIAK